MNGVMVHFNCLSTASYRLEDTTWIVNEVVERAEQINVRFKFGKMTTQTT